MNAEPINEAAADLRRAKRVRTMLGARAVFNGGNSVIDCQIRDMSETGVRIVLSEALSLPAEFELQIPSRNRTSRVALRWRLKDMAGLEFLNSKSAAAAPDLDALAAENAVLRRRVADLLKRLSDLGYSEWQS